MIIEQFISLFAEMDLVTAICLVLGLSLVIAEVFQPGFVALGVMGVIMILAGIILRVSAVPQEDVFAMIFLLVFVVVFVLALAFFLMVTTVRRPWLVGAPESAEESVQADDDSADFSALKGKLGVATTTLRPSGRVEIDDQIYDVIADGFFINKGQVVKVIVTKGSKIIVCRADI